MGGARTSGAEGMRGVNQKRNKWLQGCVPLEFLSSDFASCVAFWSPSQAAAAAGPL